MNRKSKAIQKKTVLIIAASAVAVLLLAGSGYYIWNNNREVPNPDPNGDSLGYVNYGEPTEQEKQQADQNKDAVVERQKLEQEAANNQNTGQIKQVTPQISTAMQNGQEVLVTAYVPGVFEDGGTCTMTAQLGSQKVTRTSEGFANATNTGCAPFRLSRGDFPQAGNWTVVVQYTSNTAKGVSSEKQLSIQ